ncbi:MAG TPA: phosphatase PAP2 family protein [Candidatus Sulfotelmatobacter sp.]
MKGKLLFRRSVMVGIVSVAFPLAAACQVVSNPPSLLQPLLLQPQVNGHAPASIHLAQFHLETDDSSGPDTEVDTAPDNPPGPELHEGLLKRSAIRIARDQKGLYLAPFKPHNFKWDALVLAGTGAFLAADRHIEHNLPGGHFTLYQDTSDIALGGLAASLAGVYLYGAKTEHHHARETGQLELETLVNTFLIYAPMQLIAGRQRPGEGNGQGDFLKHHSVNTSFPGGHAMFTWAMASVLADEYPKPWARALSYGAAFTVTFTRFMARDHWASDMFLGSALGIAIAENTFHSHCDPQYESQCKHHQWWWKAKKNAMQ